MCRRSKILGSWLDCECWGRDSAFGDFDLVGLGILGRCQRLNFSQAAHLPQTLREAGESSQYFGVVAVRVSLRRAQQSEWDWFGEGWERVFCFFYSGLGLINKAIKTLLQSETRGN